MKNLILLGILLTSVSFFIGCSKDNTENTVSATEEIDGIWLKDSYRRLTISYGTMNYLYTYDTYLEERDVTISLRGEKNIQPNDLVVKKYYGELVSLYYTPRTQAEADSWNQQQDCGYTNWQVNVKMDCIHTRIGVSDNDIYYLKDNNLTFGDFKQIGSDGYPEALDNTRSWTKE